MNWLSRIFPVFLFLFLILYGTGCFAQEASTVPARGRSASDGNYQRYSISDGIEHQYTKPGLTDYIRNVPGDFASFWKRAFRKKHLLTIGLLTASTVILIHYDQKILDETQSLGRRLGLGNRDNTKTMLKSGKIPIFRGPTDLGSSMYFLGDGWLHIGIAFSFLGKGLYSNDYRALNTSSQLLEGLIGVGVATQLIKHATGRESPYVSTRDGGRWVFFPDQVEYYKHVARFDAFPSGHIATAMMTTIVLAENYPEHKYIKPAGYTLIGVLGFQMVNNGVHWVSDYPVSIAIGYLFGKIVVENGRKVINSGAPGHSGKDKDRTFFVGTSVSPNGTPLLTLNLMLH